MTRPTSKVVVIASFVFVLLLVGIYNFLPSFWISIFYPIHEYPSDMSRWEVAKRGLNEAKIPMDVSNKLEPVGKPSKNPQDWTFRKWIMIISDFQISQWEFFKEKKLTSENLSKAIGPFPNIHFGAVGTVTADTPNIPATLGAAYQSQFPNMAQFECRFIAFRNPSPVPESEYNETTGALYRSDHVRCVCPCGSIKGRWTLNEQVGLVDIRSGLAGVRDGTYREVCLHIDPMILLNLPPAWISAGNSPSTWIDYMQEHLSDLPGPEWPIYVEQKGLLRQATKSDMPYVSKGIFNIP